MDIPVIVSPVTPVIGTVGVKTPLAWLMVPRFREALSMPKIWSITASQSIAKIGAVWGPRFVKSKVGKGADKKLWL
jgi:hypothetical protein